MKSVFWLWGLLALSCASAPPLGVAIGSGDAVLIDWSGKTNGQTVPRWVTLALEDRVLPLEGEMGYINHFLFYHAGPESASRQEALAEAGRLDVGLLVADQLKTRLAVKVADLPADRQAAALDYLGQVAQVFGATAQTGVRQEKTFWMTKAYLMAKGKVDKDRTFEVAAVLFSMPRTAVRTALDAAAKAVEARAKAPSPEVAAIRASVRQLMAGDF